MQALTLNYSDGAVSASTMFALHGDEKDANGLDEFNARLYGVLRGIEAMKNYNPGCLYCYGAHGLTQGHYVMMFNDLRKQGYCCMTLRNTDRPDVLYINVEIKEL